MGESGKARDQASATTMVEVAISNPSNRGIRNRCTPGSSTSRPHGSSTSLPSGSDSSHNSRPHGSSRDDIHNSGDRGNSSSTPGPAGRDHPPNNSTGVELPISGDDIGAEISRTGSDTCDSGAARRSIPLQNAGKLRPHQSRSTVRTRHHLFQELMPRSTAPAPLPPGHHTTAMDIRPYPATDLRHHTTALHLPHRCHDCPDLTDHLHRRLPQNPTGASRPDNPRLYGHNTCLQASFRVRTDVQKMVVYVAVTSPRRLLGSL